MSSAPAAAPAGVAQATRRPRARALAPRTNPFARDGSSTSFAGVGAPHFLHPTQCLGYATDSKSGNENGGGGSTRAREPRDVARVRARLNVLRNAVDALHPPPADPFDNRAQPEVFWNGVISPPSYPPWPWPLPYESEIPGTQIARGATATAEGTASAGASTTITATTRTTNTTRHSSMHRITPTSPEAADASRARRAHARVATSSALLYVSTMQTDTSTPDTRTETRESDEKDSAAQPPAESVPGGASLTVSSTSLENRAVTSTSASSDVPQPASQSMPLTGTEKVAQAQAEAETQTSNTASAESENREPTDTSAAADATCSADVPAAERSITDISPSVDEVPLAPAPAASEAGESSAAVEGTVGDAGSGGAMPRDTVVEKAEQPSSPPIEMPTPTSPPSAACSVSGSRSLSPPTSLSPPSGTNIRRRRPLRARRVLPPMQVRIATSPTTPETPLEGVQRRAELVRLLERDTTGKFSIGAGGVHEMGGESAMVSSANSPAVSNASTNTNANNSTGAGVNDQATDPETGMALAFLACLSLAALLALIAMLN